MPVFVFVFASVFVFISIFVFVYVAVFLSLFLSLSLTRRGEDNNHLLASFIRARAAIETTCFSLEIFSETVNVSL